MLLLSADSRLDSAQLEHMSFRFLFKKSVWGLQTATHRILLRKKILRVTICVLIDVMELDISVTSSRLIVLRMKPSL